MLHSHSAAFIQQCIFFHCCLLGSLIEKPMLLWMSTIHYYWHLWSFYTASTMLLYFTACSNKAKPKVVFLCSFVWRLFAINNKEEPQLSWPFMIYLNKKNWPVLPHELFHDWSLIWQRYFSKKGLFSLV